MFHATPFASSFGYVYLVGIWILGACLLGSWLLGSWLLETHGYRDRGFSPGNSAVVDLDSKLDIKSLEEWDSVLLCAFLFRIA